MTILLAIHTAGGAVAVIAGYGALLAGKGNPFHRYAGYGSVVGMRAMALGAMAVAPEEGETKHVVTAVLVTYIVWHSCSSREEWPASRSRRPRGSACPIARGRPRTSMPTSR